MTETGLPNAGEPSPAERPRRCGPGRGRIALAAVAVLLAGAAIGGFASRAFSHGPFGHHGHHGPGALSMIAAPGGAIDPAKAEERIERFARHFGVEVDATKEQQEKINTIARSAIKELLPLRDKLQDGRRRMLDLIAAPAIDRSAIDTLRAEQMAVAEQASKRIAGAVADTAEVLTPEQRKKLSERVQQMHARRSWWHRG